MSSNAIRAAVGAAVVIVAVALFIVLKDDSGGDGGSTATSTDTGSNTRTDGTAGTDGTASTPKPLTIVIRNGKPVGGVQDLTYNEGERVRFRVDSDVADEIHVHGYDIAKDVEAGGTVSFDFPATIEGVFEAELEDRKEQILELTVNP